MVTVAAVFLVVVTIGTHETERDPIAERAEAAWLYAESRLDDVEIADDDLDVWSAALADAVRDYGYVGGRMVVPPELVVAVAWRESRLDPDAVLPGCPRRGRRPRRCNSDGRPDVGLCQLRVGPRWSRVTEETARDPEVNIRECVRQLRTHYLAHHQRGCVRRGWAERWPEWGAWDDHLWLQHHNPASRYHGARTTRLWRAVRRGVRRMIDE